MVQRSVVRALLCSWCAIGALAVSAFAVEPPFTYNTDGTRKVVDPLGHSVIDTTDTIARQRRYTGSDSQCESCGDEYARLTYDSAGNFESTTDLNAVEARHEHDVARTLETERTEAAGTARERTQRSAHALDWS